MIYTDSFANKGGEVEGPLVSVIIPVYNGERYLSSAIESVLQQKYRPLEILVVDDGSVDESAHVAQSYTEVRYIYQENRGPAGARNTGIMAANGEFIAYLDHDDAWLPNLLEVHIGYLLSHPEVGFTICTGRCFLDDGIERPGWVEPEELQEDRALLGAQVVRRSAFDRVGLLDSTYRLAEDTEWVFRAEDAGVPRAVLPDLVFRRRIHSGNVSHDWQAAYKQLLRCTRAAMQRRRSRETAGAQGEGRSREMNG